MSITVTFDGDVGGIVDRIARGVSGESANAVMRAAVIAAGELRRTSRDLNKTGQAKGGLSRSFRETFVAAGEDEISAGAYSDLVYADIQDRGGVIRPRRGKMLAIPLKGAGVPRGKWPRDYPKGALFRVGSALATRAGSRGKLKFLFALKSSVRIPPTNYIAKAEESLGPLLVAHFAGVAQKAIDGA